MAKTKVHGEYLQDSVVRFTAKAGENITKGQPVYISGISGELPVVSLADADDTAKMPAFGLAEATVSTNAEVEITSFGTLAGLDTSTPGYSLGDILYVDTTAGALTNDPAGLEATKLQNIGIVQRVHASNGSIKVGGAGRTNAVPNLDDGDIFIGDSNNKAISSSLATEIESYLDGGTSTPTFSTATVTGDLTVDTDTLYVDSTNNKVGIGNSSPANNSSVANNLVVGNGTAGGIANYVGTGTGWYAFSRDNANNTDAYDGGISYDGSRNLKFHTNAGTERLTINGAGDMHLGQSDADVKLYIGSTGGGFGGNASHNMRASSNQLMFNAGGATGLYTFEVNGSEKIRFPSSGGITFNGDTSSANALDDYEEGAWTPVLKDDTASTTYTHAVGRYIKIGTMVQAWFHIDVGNYDAAAGTNILGIEGLPFTSSNTTNDDYGSVSGLHCNNWDSSSKPDNALIQKNTNHANFYKSQGQTGIAGITHDHMRGGNILGCFHYRSA
jgi:hypothetical protein